MGRTIRGASIRVPSDVSDRGGFCRIRFKGDRDWADISEGTGIYRSQRCRHNHFRTSNVPRWCDNSYGRRRIDCERGDLTADRYRRYTGQISSAYNCCSSTGDGSRLHGKRRNHKVARRGICTTQSICHREVRCKSSYRCWRTSNGAI